MVRAASMLSWSMAKKPEQRGKASAGPAKPGLSRDDTDLFHAAMEDVEPVAGAKAAPPPSTPVNASGNVSEVMRTSTCRNNASRSGLDASTSNMVGTPAPRARLAARAAAFAW